MGIKISFPTTTGPYRFTALAAVPLAWSNAECDAHLASLIRRYTGYFQRALVEGTLIEQLKVDSKKAFAAAAVIARIFNEGEPEVETPSDQQPLFPKKIPMPGEPVETERLIPFREGGWAKLVWVGDMFQVSLSVRAADHSGFGDVLKGYVRRRAQRLRSVTAHPPGIHRCHALRLAKARGERCVQPRGS